jgi:hypothetical protein
MENKRHIELGTELGHECRVLATGCSRVVVNVVHVDNKAGVEGEQQQSDRVRTARDRHVDTGAGADKGALAQEFAVHEV